MEAHRARAELDEAMLTVAGAHTDLGAGDVALLQAVVAQSHDGHTRERARMILLQLGVTD